jgi:undecaprenyl-diphosphatase
MEFSPWDIRLFALIHGLSGRSIFADLAGIFFAQYLPYLLILGFLMLVFREPGARRKFYLFAEGTLAVILARGIIASSIHYFYHTARPFVFFGFAPLIGESGSSFPSGHMTWFFALATTVWYADRKWGIWYFLLTCIMGIARVYVGVHWPLDILGGAVIGLLSGWFIHWLLRSGRKEISKEASPALQ